MPASSRTVAVALPLPVRKEFSYSIPDGMPAPAPGARVRVPFGERVLTGIVTGGAPESERALRDVLEVLDAEPVCPAELLASAQRVAHRFFVSTGEVLKSALPARLARSRAARYELTDAGARAGAVGAERDVLEMLARGTVRRASELSAAGRTDTLRALERKGWIRVAPHQPPRVRSFESVYRLAPLDPAERDRLLARRRRGREVVAFLARVGREATGDEIRNETGAGAAILKNLVSRSILTREHRPRSLDPTAIVAGPARDFLLTGEQQSALGSIVEAVNQRRYLPALLQGVTGSGKTEVYLRAIAAALAAGRGAIWLVPEIALTPVFASELSRQFGDGAALMHSALSAGQRTEAWDRIRSGRARVVIGPRSAVFAPLPDPGLILVDEEHDSSYKQRESPRYDAREVAAIRARASRAVLLFGSATPSMEAYHAAETGRVLRLRLSARVVDRPLPQVEIVDLKHEPFRPEEKGVPLFSRPLLERLREVFRRGEQAILLQPRRGYAPILLCRDCGYDFRCDRCSVSRTVHARGRALVCHYCGSRIAAPARCPECGGGLLEPVGAGTERVAERFAEAFPGVTFGLLDRDSARRLGAENVVRDMLSGRIQCLIGTQMVAKGHDFPNVTAVGVLSADTILNFPDFRAAERTFQLVAQVAGRAGRGEKAGTVHVQTFHPKHPAIVRAADHDVDGFATAELGFRRAFFYPPYSELAEILVTSSELAKAESAAREIGEALRKSSSRIRVSGPAPAPLERLLGRWRQQILVRAGNREAILESLEKSVSERPPAGVQVATDVDPQDLM
ncbi:MAG TPA: primosomal protein N' [Thermoanaerobaculia bacterium]